MTRDEADQEIVDRIKKICTELELALQEASNRGLYVCQVVDRGPYFHQPVRPIAFNITRTIEYKAHP